MSYFVFVDNSNVWIEGKYASAVSKGYASNVYEAHEKGLQDNAWRLDYGKLLRLVTKNNTGDIKHAIMFGSKPPKNDSLWNAIKASQFEVVALDRNINNKEKAVDTGIVQEIAKYLYRYAHEGDTFVLVMGDKDFIPSVKAIQDEKCDAVVAFWNNASGEIISEASSYIDLTPHLTQITY